MIKLANKSNCYRVGNGQYDIHLFKMNRKVQWHCEKLALLHYCWPYLFINIKTKLSDQHFLIIIFVLLFFFLNLQTNVCSLKHYFLNQCKVQNTLFDSSNSKSYFFKNFFHTFFCSYKYMFCFGGLQLEQLHPQTPIQG